MRSAASRAPQVKYFPKSSNKSCKRLLAGAVYYDKVFRCIHVRYCNLFEASALFSSAPLTHGRRVKTQDFKTPRLFADLL